VTQVTKSPIEYCMVCASPTPPERASDVPWLCSIACYRIFHGLDGPAIPAGDDAHIVDPSASPLCHDGVTMPCPICQRPFTPTGRRKFCSDGCRAAAYRRRRDAGRAPVTVPKAKPRRPVTVYECDSCGDRAVGQQRCDTCSTFMRRVGIGGECPACSAPVAVGELLGEEAAT